MRFPMVTRIAFITTALVAGVGAEEWLTAASQTVGNELAARWHRIIHQNFRGEGRAGTGGLLPGTDVAGRCATSADPRDTPRRQRLRRILVTGGAVSAWPTVFRALPLT